MPPISRSTLNRWIAQSFQKEQTDSQHFPVFEKLFLAEYEREERDEKFKAFLGANSFLIAEFLQFLETAPCPESLTAAVSLDFKNYLIDLEDGIPSELALDHTLQRKEGFEDETGIESSLSGMDSETRLDFLSEYLLSHGKSEHTANDCAFSTPQDTPIAEMLSMFQKREREEELAIAMGYSPERAYAYAKCYCEGGSTEEAALFSWYYEKQIQRQTDIVRAQELAKDFSRFFKIYAPHIEDKNFEANTYAVSHLEAFHRGRFRHQENDFIELFITVAERLQPQKKTDSESDFYHMVELLTCSIARGEMSLSVLPPHSNSEYRGWRQAFRNFCHQEEFPHNFWDEDGEETKDKGEEFQRDQLIEDAVEIFAGKLQKE